jgi:predicted dithiol-disulfide oxidoreductase (DUF899 family)
MPVAEAIDIILSVNHFLDLMPLGRNERGPDGNVVDWVRRHDQYEDKPASKSCCHDEAHA